MLTMVNSTFYYPSPRQMRHIWIYHRDYLSNSLCWIMHTSRSTENYSLSMRWYTKYMLNIIAKSQSVITTIMSIFSALQISRRKKLALDFVVSVSYLPLSFQVYIYFSLQWTTDFKPNCQSSPLLLKLNRLLIVLSPSKVISDKTKLKPNFSEIFKTHDCTRPASSSTMTLEIHWHDGSHDIVYCTSSSFWVAWQYLLFW